MQPEDPEDTPEFVLTEAPATPLKRLLALIALVALLASASLSSWWILTGQASFRADPPAAGEAAEP